MSNAIATAVDIVTRTGAFIESHEAIITALATIVIAVFTWALASSTKKLWKETKKASAIAKTSADAAKATANAMIASERAWVGVSRIEMSPRKFSEVSVREFNVSIALINYGRTIARIRSSFHGRFHIVNDVKELPAVPDYPDLLRMEGAQYTNIFLKPNETLTTTTIPLESTKPTPKELEAITGCQKQVFLYGRVTYFDFADQERITQFCYEYIPLTESFEIGGPREYNKHI